MSPSLLLASGSPRRQAFLRSFGIVFEICVPSIEETPLRGEAPRSYVRRIALEKLQSAARLWEAGKEGTAQLRPPGEPAMLAADTVVVLDDALLGKPRDEAEARAILARLSGRKHQVLTAVVGLRGGQREEALVCTEVRFRTLKEAEIRWYVSTGEPMDKAGAYGLQGLGGCLVSEIRGSHSNVIGLPLPETLALLAALGVPLPWTQASRLKQEQKLT